MLKTLLHYSFIWIDLIGKKPEKAVVLGDAME